MKCLETEKLIRYAYRLSDETAAAQVRAHLRECQHCREIVEEHGRLDAILNEWKVADPTPRFDARVRQAVEAQEARHSAWGFWGWQWTRGLALASLGVLIVAGVVGVTRTHFWSSHSSPALAGQSQTTHRTQTPPQAAKLHSPRVPVHVAKGLVHVAPELRSVGVGLNDDRDAQALEDYDLAANFDLLSELPKGEPRVAN